MAGRGKPVEVPWRGNRSVVCAASIETVTGTLSSGTTHCWPNFQVTEKCYIGTGNRITAARSAVCHPDKRRVSIEAPAHSIRSTDLCLSSPCRFASRILSLLSPTSLSLTALARRNGRSVIDAMTSFATRGHQT